jgi:hypothetical protein
MDVQLGKFKLIETASICLIQQDSFEITLPDEIEGDYAFQFMFITDEKENNAVTNIIPINNLLVSIKFVNFHKTKEIANLDLIPVGSLKSKNLFISYIVNNISTRTRQICINFFIEEGK